MWTASGKHTLFLFEHRWGNFRRESVRLFPFTVRRHHPFEGLGLLERVGILVKLKCDVNMREILETLQSFWTNVPRETYD